MTKYRKKPVKPKKLKTWFVDETWQAVVHGNSGAYFQGVNYLRQISKFFAEAADWLEYNEKEKSK